ncbi:MAG: hypothetical protein IH991_16240 [Planctomycetes bacterium]|nr:hypothetical protein [Planctomycetota bacterium]
MEYQSPINVKTHSLVDGMRLIALGPKHLTGDEVLLIDPLPERTINGEFLPVADVADTSSSAGVVPSAAVVTRDDGGGFSGTLDLLGVTISLDDLIAAEIDGVAKLTGTTEISGLELFGKELKAVADFSNGGYVRYSNGDFSIQGDVSVATEWGELSLTFHNETIGGSLLVETPLVDIGFDVEFRDGKLSSLQAKASDIGKVFEFRKLAFRLNSIAVGGELRGQLLQLDIGVVVGLPGGIGEVELKLGELAQPEIIMGQIGEATGEAIGRLERGPAADVRRLHRRPGSGGVVPELDRRRF